MPIDWSREDAGGPRPTPERTEAERIAAGLKGSEPMAIAYLSRVSSDMMPKTIETDEQLAAAITFSRLADQRLAVSTLTADSIEWRLTPLGRAVAEAIRAQECDDAL